MSVLVVGLSHRSAPVEVLERAAVPTHEIPKLLDEMLGGSHVTEVMMLSTCNRIEVYAVVDAFHGGLADVSTCWAGTPRCRCPSSPNTSTCTTRVRPCSTCSPSPPGTPSS